MPLITSTIGTTTIDPETGVVVHTHAYDEYGQCPCFAWKEFADALGEAAPRDAEGGYLCCPGMMGKDHDAQCENFVDDGTEAGTYEVTFHRGDDNLDPEQFVVFNFHELEYLLHPRGRELGADGALVVWLHPQFGPTSMVHVSIESAGEVAEL